MQATYVLLPEKRLFPFVSPVLWRAFLYPKLAVFSQKANIDDKIRVYSGETVIPVH